MNVLFQNCRYDLVFNIVGTRVREILETLSSSHKYTMTFAEFWDKVYVFNAHLF